MIGGRSAKGWCIGLCHIAYGTGCIVLGILVMLGTIGHVPFPGLFEWAGILGGAFCVWFGSMAIWWDDL